MVRIGLIGASRIAPAAAILPARAEGSGVEIVAVAARDRARAAAYAADWAIPHVAESYQALMARDDVDVLYVSTTPSTHADLAVAGAGAGKHVWMEKPFSIAASETQRALDAARAAGVRLIEATHYLYHPTMKRAFDAVHAGKIGRVRRVTAVFDTPVAMTPGELRWSAALGGGRLRDIGFYPLHVARTAFGAEPVSVRVMERCDGDEVDAALAATLTFAGGEAVISCDMRAGTTPRADAVIEGEAGRITISAFIQPMLGKLRIETREGVEEIAGEKSYTYPHQLAAVRGAIVNGSPLPTESADILGQARALDMLYGAEPEKRARYTP